MDVHSTPVDALEGNVQPCNPAKSLDFEAGDLEWVADLLDTLRAGDPDGVAAQLDQLAHVIRKAAKARRLLATIDPVLLREGLALCHSRSVQ